MFHQALDLTEVFWKAEHSDEKIIYKGPNQYEKIDRNQLEIFTLTYKNKPILEVHPKGRTLIWRMKTIANLNLSTRESSVRARIHIVSLLAKPGSNNTDQRCQIPFNDNFEPQIYFHDMEETIIYYLFENGKTETRVKYSMLSPYTAPHLREDEYLHLMGREEEKIAIKH